MKPTIGRIVLFHPHTLVHRPWAAIVVGVIPNHPGRPGTAQHPGISTGDTVVNLYVFANHAHGNSFVEGIPFTEEARPGCWSWPPREAPPDEEPPAGARPEDVQ